MQLDLNSCASDLDMIAFDRHADACDLNARTCGRYSDRSPLYSGAFVRRELLWPLNSDELEL